MNFLEIAKYKLKDTKEFPNSKLQNPNYASIVILDRKLLPPRIGDLDFEIAIFGTFHNVNKTYAKYDRNILK